MTGFDVFKIYTALRLHFTTSYNYNKYDGRVSVKYNSFIKRKDRGRYADVGRRLDNLYEVKQFFIFCFSTIKKFSIFSIDNSTYDAYNVWKVRQKSDLVYFQRDTEKIFEEMTLEEALIGDGVPGVVRMYLLDEISIDTIAIIDHFLPFLSKCELVPHINKQVTAYKSFLNLKPVTMQKILFESIEKYRSKPKL